MLIPNLKFLTNSLENICKVTQCDEVILFEKSTMLVIAFFGSSVDPKRHFKYEGVSTIVKLFKRSCQKAGADILNIAIQNPGCEAVIADFTANTFISFVSRALSVKSGALALNIDCARSFLLSNAKMLENVFAK